jgi:integrase/recombinase XerD
LLYGTGIRASECASLRNSHVDLKQLVITVRGKGGNERAIPLNPQLAELLKAYVQARGAALASAPFFRSRFGRLLSRGSVYERVRTWGQRSRIGIRLSPHRMCHTFATLFALASASSRYVICSDIVSSRAPESICMSPLMICALLRSSIPSASFLTPSGR